MLAEPAAPADAQEVAAIVHAVKRFAADHIDAQHIDRQHRIPRELLESLGELGVFGLSIPETHGGLGLSIGAICEVIAGLAEHDRSVATTIGLHLGLGTRALVAFADPATQDRVLPALATGEHLAAFAATEPGAGSDLRGVATRATSTPSGLVVSGEKLYVTNGGLAQIFTMLAETPGLGGRRRSYSLLWLDRDDGLSIGVEEDKLGLRGSSTTAVHLDDLCVGSDRIIGEPGHGMEQVAHVLAWGRTVMAAGCIGSATSALHIATRHVHQRVQFGKTLAQQAVVQEQLADAAALHFAMAAMVQHTTSASTDAELEHRSLATKVLCSEGGWQICDRAIQLYGGGGYIEHTGLPLLLRDARITRIFEGANDVLISLLGTLSATQPPQHWSLTGPGSSQAAELCGRLDQRHKHLRHTHKIRLLRQPRLLAQLGRMAVIRQSLTAVVTAAQQAKTPAAEELALHWTHLCHAQLAPHLTEPQNMARVRRIAAHAAEEILP